MDMGRLYSYSEFKTMLIARLRSIYGDRIKIVKMPKTNVGVLTGVSLNRGNMQLRSGMTCIFFHHHSMSSSFWSIPESTIQQPLQIS